MSLKDAIERADPILLATKERQKKEDIMLQHEHRKYWDSFYKARVKSFALETNNPEVLKAYYQMINGNNTDAYYSENNFVNK